MTIIRHLRYTLAEVEDPKIILVQLGMPSKSKSKVLDREFKSKIIDFLASHFPTHRLRFANSVARVATPMCIETKAPTKKLPR